MLMQAGPEDGVLKSEAQGYIAASCLKSDNNSVQACSVALNYYTPFDLFRASVIQIFKAAVRFAGYPQCILE